MGGGGDPYWNSVSYLLVGNGANGTTTNIKDSSSNNLTTTITGNTVISTAQSKFGTGSSVFFDGSNDYLTVPTSSLLAFGTGNLTLEFWFYTSAKTNTYPCIYANSPYAADDFQIFDRHNSYPTKLAVFAYNYHPSNPILLSSSNIVNNTWYYVAVVRNGSTFTLYLNGASEATATYSGNLDGGTSKPCYIGTDTNSGNWFNGYIYDFRITKSVARYTSNFVPGPSGPFPTYGP